MELSWLTEAVEEVERALAGSPSSTMHETRKASLALLTSEGLPTSKSEEWKYTSLRSLASGSYRLAPGELSDVEVSARESLEDASNELQLFLANGALALGHEKTEQALQSLRDMGVDVQFVSDKDLLEGQTPEGFGEVFNSICTEQTHPTLTINGSLFSGVLWLRIPENVTISSPIVLENIVSPGVVSCPRIAISVGPRSEVSFLERILPTVCEEYSSSAQIAVIEGVVASQAKLTWNRLQGAKDSDVSLSYLAVKQEKESTFSATVINLGGGLSRSDIAPVQDGESSFTALYGLNVAQDEQHFDNRTLLDHALPHGESDQLFKGVYSGKSKGVFNGTIIVRPDAQKTNAIQSNQSLLLSETAASNAQPQLKIWADDVRCTHGATVGQLDEDAYFYLRSRGIPSVEARRMLIESFTYELLEKVECEVSRSIFRDAIRCKLEGLA